MLGKGELQSVDGYMNIALEQTKEYVDGNLRRNYGDAFVRGNNGELPCGFCQREVWHTNWDSHVYLCRLMMTMGCNGRQARPVIGAIDGNTRVLKSVYGKSKSMQDVILFRGATGLLPLNIGQLIATFGGYLRGPDSEGRSMNSYSSFAIRLSVWTVQCFHESLVRFLR